MEALALWMLAIGVADLIAPTAPGSAGKARMILATVSLALVAGGGGIASGLSLTAVGVLTAVAGLLGGLWLWLWRLGWGMQPSGGQDILSARRGPAILRASRPNQDGQ